jgi:hypothetical protein
MVQPAFDIRNESLESLPEECRLLIEISAQAFNYILFTRSPDQLLMLRQYRLYTTGDKNTRNLLEEIIAGDEIMQRYASRAIVVYNFPESNILPSSLANAELRNAVSSLIYGSADHHFLFDEKIRDHDLHNIYSVSKDLHSLCREKFKGSQYWHLYTMMLLWPSEKPLGCVTRVIFYNDKFVAAFFRNGKLQLLQSFSYQTPEDAAYYLLLICKQFEIQQQEMVLNISGLIDTQSALYTELLKYFVHVDYEEVPESYGTNGLLDEFPSHYFSPLLKMSLCV